MSNMSGSGYSNVGDRRLYEGGDQRNVANADLQEMDRTHNGNIKAYQSGDAKQKLAVSNKITEQDQKASGEYTETAAAQRDPTAPDAVAHGNQPSRGAKIDKELQEDDEAILKKKGDAMPGKK